MSLERFRGQVSIRTRAKRVSGHSYDNVTNPGGESGACGNAVDARAIRCRETGDRILLTLLRPRTFWSYGGAFATALITLTNR